MDPSTNNGGIELPPPVPEQSTTPALSGEVSNSAPETLSAPSPEMASNNNGPLAGSIAPPPTIIDLPGATPPLQTPPTTALDNSSSGATPKSNKDLIDKEWVDKAKAIVERTKDNPYQQSNDLNLLKAEFMKKQYNKTLKIAN